MRLGFLMTALLLGTLVGCTQRDRHFGEASKAGSADASMPGPQIEKKPLTPPQAAPTGGPSDAQSCAIDLCGPAENSAQFSGVDTPSAQSLEAVKPFFRSEVQPLLDRNFSAVSEVSKSESLNALIGQFEAGELDDAQKGFFISVGLLKIFSEKQSQLKLDLFSSDSQGHTIINRENVVIAFPEWSPDQIYDAVSTANVLLSSSYFKAFLGWSGMTLDSFFAQSSTADRAETVKALAKYVESVKRIIGEGAYWNFDLASYEALKEGKELNDFQKNEVMSITTTSFLYLGALAPEMQVQVRKIKLGVQDVRAEILKTMRDKEKKTSIDYSQNQESVRHQIMSRCESNVVRLLATGATEEKLRNHEKTIAFIKASAKKVLARYAEGASLQAGLDVIDASRFLNPPTQKIVRQNLVDKLFLQAKKNREVLNRAENLAKGDVGARRYFVATLLFSGLSQEPGFAERALADICEGLKPASPSDRAMLSGAIQVGWQSVALPEVGVGILAHELGHLVSNAISKQPGHQPYDEARQCTASVHESLGLEKSATALYAEEDWADTFAGSLLKEVNSRWPHARNFACPLIDLDGDGKVYGGTESWNRPSFDGSHSQSLLRALLIQKSMGLELPASCQQMAAKAGLSTVPACGL